MVVVATVVAFDDVIIVDRSEYVDKFPVNKLKIYSKQPHKQAAII